MVALGDTKATPQCRVLIFPVGMDLFKAFVPLKSYDLWPSR
jgi:hypothetical protein